MKPIIAPLSVGDQNEEVANLNSALLFLLDKVLIDPTPLGGTPPDAAFLTDNNNNNMSLYGEGTSGIIRMFRELHGLGSDANVDPATATALNDLLHHNGAFDEQTQYKVSGVVLNKLGEPIANQAVMALDVDLRGARIYKTVADVQGILDNQGFELLGEATTDTNGLYEISFNATSFSNAEIDKADVVVYALEQHNTITGRSLLSTNKDYSGGTELTNWNIILETDNQRGIAEYARIMQPVNNLLQRSHLSLFELFDSREQIEFLANETGQDLRKVTLLVQAAKLSADVGATELSFHEILYGIGRQNVALDWTAIGLTSESRLRDAVAKSIDQNIITVYNDDIINSFLQVIHEHSTNIILDDSNEATTTDIKKLLNYSLPNTALHAVFLTAYKNFTGKPEQFWNDNLPKQPGFEDPSLIQSLQFGNQLTMLTGNHLPLIKELQVNRRFTSPQQLVEFTADDWKNTLEIAGWPAGLKEEGKLAYIAGMQNRLYAAYPTQKIALMVDRDELKYDNSLKQPLKAFLTATDFNFTKSRVTDYKEKIDLATNGNGQLSASVVNHLQIMQRVFQVSPTPEAMVTLIDKDLTSAYKIANIPDDSFVKMHGKDLGEDIAAKVHAKAAYQLLRVQNAAMMIHELTNGIMPAATTFSAQQNEIAAVIEKYVPNYKKLFG